MAADRRKATRKEIEEIREENKKWGQWAMELQEIINIKEEEEKD
jgi:hypothetical protein